MSGGRLERRKIRKILVAETGWPVESHVNGTVDVRPPAGIAAESAIDQIRAILAHAGY